MSATPPTSDQDPPHGEGGSGIPAVPEGLPTSGAGTEEFDAGSPVGPAPEVNFWDVIYGRRSVRKFEERAVPRELVEQVMHAGIWAPSSCNYQMWDLVAVDDAALNAELARLSTQMGNAPVNLVVSYGREFSAEHWANVQSASALIQNMSLAASALGLGTFWITQMGDAELLRERVGLPYDRVVVAVLALGYPRILPDKGPKRRPLSQVAHWNHYAGRPIPSSARPADWPPDLLAIYQRARVLNGLRHNKPRAWERRALETALEALVPGAADPGSGATPRWLDVLPCTGILTEHLARRRKGYGFDVVERTPEVAEWCVRRTRPQGSGYAWPDAQPERGFDAPAEESYDLVSCLFRLEGLAPGDRPRLVADMARWLKPGGILLLGHVSSRSFHDWTERLRARRGGPRGVEYVLSPDPSIGPFEALAPAAVEALCQEAGLELEARLGLQPTPQTEELSFRTRNFSPRSQKLFGLLGDAIAQLGRLPGLPGQLGRFRFLKLRRPGQ